VEHGEHHEAPHRTGTRYGPGEFRGEEVVFNAGGELTPRSQWKPDPEAEARYHLRELEPERYRPLEAKFPGAWWHKPGGREQ
jgi:hypothetical protein